MAKKKEVNLEREKIENLEVDNSTLPSTSSPSNERDIMQTVAVKRNWANVVWGEIYE